MSCNISLKIFFFRVILNSLDPIWNESYRSEVCHSAECLTFEVRDKDHAYAEFIGSVYIPVVGGLLVSWYIPGVGELCITQSQGNLQGWDGA